MLRSTAIAATLLAAFAATAGAQNRQPIPSQSTINYFALPERPLRNRQLTCPDPEAGSQPILFDDIGCWSPTTYSMPTEGSWLQMRVTPALARVYVNGKFAGYVQQFAPPYRGVRLGEGPQMIELWAPGFKRQSFWMSQEREQTSTLSGKLEATKPKTP